MTQSGPETIRLMIVDDQELMRDGLVSILARQSGIEVVGTASDGVEAVQMALDVRPDVMLMDVRMPVMDGVAATAEIHKKAPDCRVIMLTTFDDEEYIITALQSGAVGYILKNVPAQDLAEAVRLAHKGLVQLDSTAALKVVSSLGNATGHTVNALDGAAMKRFEGLTEREREVMHLIAQGASNREIADTLVISEGTVKSHISSILGQLGLRDRTQVAVFVYQNGLI
ncbi:MAG: response regulator transcription factor [Chloroflexi bacterium AL-W]|nr:response regulator transcription factor [Blastochloris sp.]NOK64265.1 response regulator transcription factor [Chloroflexi bacterium AL-N1]NOK71510.1 response regulator transcription factor [Chloroflexi bacterium AL-N10]NOK78856.1 response regulator transcription factor [Chloroflexi bacterium AL-N5]NOK86332.1 response regulator transcription factor [Chloroflexi bacterium AL-W]NOK93301.1 response regulator transcription factor [Chloroflexi bacterium AL-N15]